MKIYKVDFNPIYPVPSGLILCAKDEKEAIDIARKTITHTQVLGIEELDIKESKVLFYESGDY